MNAIVSGSAGVAVIVEGGSLFSIDIDRLDELVPRQSRDIAYLLGDAKDQQFVERVDAAAVRRLLDEAWRSSEALQIALILLDGELDDETRELAAQELEEALAVRGTAAQVEAVLWSKPLPGSASLAGAIGICQRARAKAARALFEALRAWQGAIREVWESFERVPDRVFGTDVGDRERARAGLVRAGVFRELAAARAAGKPVGDVAALVLMRPAVKAIRNQRGIVQAWVKPLSERWAERREVAAELWSVREPQEIYGDKKGKSGQ